MAIHYITDKKTHLALDLRRSRGHRLVIKKDYSERDTFLKILKKVFKNILIVNICIKQKQNVI